MKKEIKKSLFAFLTILLTVAFCTLIAGCAGNGEADSTPIGTIPPETTATTQGENPPETTGNTSTSSEDTTGGGTPIIPPVGSYINPLTGIPTTKDLSNTKPLAIVVDNLKSSYARQTGLDQADILYEALVAPGITRFLMVVADYTTVDSVCNIRSGRDYHLDLAAYHNAVLMCHGGSKTVHYDFYQMAADRLGSRWGFIDTQQEYWFATVEAGNKYGTITHYEERLPELKYDTLFKPAALTALLNSKSAYFVKAGGTITGTPKQSLKFVDYGTTKSMAGASSATTINLEFTCQGVSLAGKKVSFRYDATTDKYLRFQDGAAHVDSETNKQLSFTNVITLFTDVENVKSGISSDPDMTLVETRGSGTGYYFYGGKVIQITWRSDGSTLTLTDPLGNELTLATGNTYIGYLDNDYIYGGTTFWS